MKKQSWLVALLAAALLILTLGVGPPASYAAVASTPALVIDEATMFAAPIVTETATVIATATDGVIAVTALVVTSESNITAALALALMVAFLAVAIFYITSAAGAAKKMNDATLRIRQKVHEHMWAARAKAVLQRAKGWVGVQASAWSPRVIPG